MPTSRSPDYLAAPFFPEATDWNLELEALMNEEMAMKNSREHEKMAAVLLLVTLLGLACKDDGTQPPPVPERVKLTLIDVAVKEAFIHITVNNPASNETLSLQRNAATVMVFPAVADTNIADTTLTQNTAYQYTASLTANRTATGTSNTISTQTLAPTSHNFTWQTFLLGDGNNSSLSDVAIINDSLVYAVGEFYLRDSSGTNETRYNLAKWNGISWTPLQIQFFTICGQATRTAYPASAIFAFSASDIWIAMRGDQVARWNGTTQTSTECLPVSFSITKLWGESPNSMYAVGDGGNIMRYYGASWQRLESGTTTQINDAWGVVNPVTGKEEVYCPVTDFFDPVGKKILRIIDQTRVDSVRWNTGRDLSSIWTNKGVPLYTTGDGIFENKQGAWNEINLGTSVYTNRIRGNRLNDICLVGSFGLVAHYNGIDWRVYSEVYNAIYSGLSVRDGIVAAVGERNGRGVVTIGRR